MKSMTTAKRLGRPLLILDLDETLIHAVKGKEAPMPADAFTIEGYSVFRRPDLALFLDYCFKYFKVAIWTSSTADYCTKILDVIAGGRSFEFVWTRDRCSRRYEPELQSYFWHKTLKKVLRLGYQKERILAIDDSPEKWRSSYGNLVRVNEFTGDTEDDELVQLMHYLEMIRGEPKFRTIEKRNWRRIESWQ
jgi:RNA polymerase II subunit A small phosphatase-like protein